MHENNIIKKYIKIFKKHISVHLLENFTSNIQIHNVLTWKMNSLQQHTTFRPQIGLRLYMKHDQSSFLPSKVILTFFFTYF